MRTSRAPFETTLIGDDEDWDLVAIGSYPSRAALLMLFDDEAYRNAWAHRVAAAERQRVLIAAGEAFPASPGLLPSM